MPPPKIEVKNLGFRFGSNRVLKGVSMSFPEKRVTAIIGPSGCGKSTLIRILNRIYELYPDQHAEGEARLNGKNLFAEDLNLLRTRVGMVFQQSTVFPSMSIRENILFGVKLFEKLSRSEKEERLEHGLRQAALWNEVKDRLSDSPSNLSGGQQQRLCIARSLAIRPEVLLLDEPCSALDPRSTAKIENLIDEIKKDCTVIIVTHNMQQASRVSDYTGFLLKTEVPDGSREYTGTLVEFGTAEKIFENPTDERTEHYITGRYG